jgi:hypothetical protein
VSRAEAILAEHDVGFDGIVEQILRGDAPRHIRSAAARGALPLPRTSLVRLYIALREDEDEEVRFNSRANLEGLDAKSICEVLEDTGCTSQMFAFFADRASRDPLIAEKMTFRREVPPAVLETLATRGTAAVIELVLTNQERLLEQPRLLDRLSINPALRADQRGKILELLDRATRSVSSDAGDAGADEPMSDAAVEAAKLLQVDIGELFAASEIVDGDEFEQAEDPVVRDAYKKILTLTTAQKAILAMRGGREERMILVRDSNKLVSLAVLRNPRLNEDDIEHYARMRNVSAELLRGIGRNRDWLKSYTIAAALVSNPKTPPGVSTNLIGRLRNNELKRIVVNHDVPELIRRMAKRTISTRSQAGSKLRR